MIYFYLVPHIAHMFFLNFYILCKESIIKKTYCVVNNITVKKTVAPKIPIVVIN